MTTHIFVVYYISAFVHGVCLRVAITGASDKEEATEFLAKNYGWGFKKRGKRDKHSLRAACNACALQQLVTLRPFPWDLIVYHHLFH